MIARFNRKIDDGLFKIILLLDLGRKQTTVTDRLAGRRDRQTVVHQNDRSAELTDRQQIAAAIRKEQHFK